MTQLTDLRVPIGLGTNTFARTSDPETSREILDRFAAAGGSLIDTADTYADGVAEEVLGDWMRSRGNRDELLVTTKVGNRPPFDRLSAEAITRGLDDSLRRLGVEHVDLYLAHYQDDQTPLEESAAAFDRLVRAGKIGAVGLSNLDAATVRRWIEVARSGGLAVPVVLQPHYSLAARQPYELEHAAVAVSEDLLVMPYRALGGGFLSGKYRTGADTEGAARGPNVRPLLTPAGLHLLDTVDGIASAHAVRPVAVALAWLLAQPTVTAPLVSATSTAQLDDVLGAALLSLSDDEIDALTEASDVLRGHG